MNRRDFWAAVLAWNEPKCTIMVHLRSGMSYVGIIQKPEYGKYRTKQSIVLTITEQEDNPRVKLRNAIVVEGGKQ